MSNALLLQVLAGVDGYDDRQLAGTPFPGQVPNYAALLSAARANRALLSVPDKVPGSSPGDIRKLRVGVLKEGYNFPAMDSRVAACVKAAAGKFESLGAEVVEVSVPGHTMVPMLGRAQRSFYSFTSHRNPSSSILFRIAANSLLGRHTGTRQMHMTDLTERLLPWTQEKFENVCRSFS